MSRTREMQFSAKIRSVFLNLQELSQLLSNFFIQLDGKRVWNHQKTEFSTLPRDFHIVGGYPSVYGGKLKKLSYAEITVATVSNEHFDDHNSAKRVNIE